MHGAWIKNQSIKKKNLSRLLYSKRGWLHQTINLCTAVHIPTCITYWLGNPALPGTYRQAPLPRRLPSPHITLQSSPPITSLAISLPSSPIFHPSFPPVLLIPNQFPLTPNCPFPPNCTNPLHFHLEIFSPFYVLVRTEHVQNRTLYSTCTYGTLVLPTEITPVFFSCLHFSQTMELSEVWSRVVPDPTF